MTNTDSKYPNHIDPTLVGPAFTEWRAGRPEAMERLYINMLPTLRRVAQQAPGYSDPDEALSVLTETLLTLPHSFDPYTSTALGYIMVALKRSVAVRAVPSRQVHVPPSTTRKYLELAQVYYNHGDQDYNAWVTEAYDALVEGTGPVGADISPATFLATHRAVNAEHTYIATHVTADDTYGTIDIPDSGDQFTALETHDLIHSHLLPLLEDDRERYIVYLTYGFTDKLPASLLRDAATVGLRGALESGDGLPLSASEVSAILSMRGLGRLSVSPSVVRYTLLKVLSRMQEYLTEDARRESP